MLRILDKRAPPSGNVTEWAVQTDAFLEPLVKGGLGGSNFGLLWQLKAPDRWLPHVTIPLLEWFAHVGGVAIQLELTPDARCVVSEIDASASARALTDCTIRTYIFRNLVTLVLLSETNGLLVTRGDVAKKAVRSQAPGSGAHKNTQLGGDGTKPSYDNPTYTPPTTRGSRRCCGGRPP